MNYFQLYDIPQQIVIDKEVVQKKYYKLCKQYHPDKLINATADELAQGENLIALINAGYKILMDENLTFHYYLQLLNIIGDNDNIKLPKDFLMEMMDTNEQIVEARLENNQSQIEKINLEINALDLNFKTTINKLLNNYEQEPNDGLKQDIQIIYYKQKYLKRIFELLQNI
jgi:molecular chaperone HscB